MTPPIDRQNESSDAGESAHAHLRLIREVKEGFWKGSLSPIPEQDHRKGAKQDPQIKPDRPVVNVVQIQFNPRFEILDLTPTAHLPKAGKPGLNA